MSGNLQPYRRAVRAAQSDLRVKLASGRASSDSIALARRTWQILDNQLRMSPGSVLVYEEMPPDPRTGYRGAMRWQLDMTRRANEELFPHTATDAGAAAYRRKYQEYLDLGQRIVQSPDMRHRSVVDRRRGRSYLYRENPMVPRIMRIIASELMRWFGEHPMDAAFLRQSARNGLADFLAERPDIVALLRVAQTLPLDTEVSEVRIERPLVVEAVELVIGLIPIVGSVVAAYEAYVGEDLFGYRLTDLERGILAATVLLPIAGRFVKGGRAIYSEARMVALYGRDAAAWTRILRTGSHATANARALRTIEEAEVALRTQRTIGRSLQQRAASALPSVVRGSTPVVSTVDQAVTDLFRRLSSRHAILGSLDEIAMLRILEKGPNVSHLKGQLLEELMESRVVPWLRTRTGSFALGVQTGGKQLEFIPGHLIRDASGRQITDGILAYRNNGVLDIAAIFEAKAGRHAARELSLASGSISSLSQAERAELRAFARDVLREQRAAAQEAGRSFNRTIDDVQREIALSERGGQVRRDIERLAANADDTLAEIRVGSDLISARISPTRTKFFGVLPRDVRRSNIERQLRDSNFNFEIIGVDISQRDLQSIASELVELATTLANRP